MNRVARSMQVARAMGVPIGLVLVLLQLQQNEQLLRFQIATDLRINRDSDRNVTRGEEYATTLAKPQLTPQDPTDAELVEFNAHAASIFHELTLRRLLLEQGIFEGDWKNWLIPQTCEILDNPLGRRWLDFDDNGPSGEVRAELRRRVDECGPTFLQTI